MKLDQKMNEKAALIKTEIKRIPEVLAVARSTESPVLIKGGYGMRRSDMPETQEISVRANPIDDEYIKVNGLQIIAGSDLTRQDMEDVNKPDYEDYYFHFVLNESAAAALGWDPREAVGKKMFLGSDRPGEVRAVIRDFHFESLHSPVGALVLFPLNWGNILQVKTNGKKLPETIASLEKIWKSLAPHRPFAFSFMDEDFQQLYKNEERLARVFSIFSAMAIFLACLGLFGLSAYAVQQRIKEIGIRKVLGASASHIILLLSTHFVKLVGLAFLFAAPLSWFVMHNWLQNFAYRIGISWWLFSAAALIMLTITLLTISFQIIKAALSNPVHHLRTE
jgi:putative ABC transport system permease protein